METNRQRDGKSNDVFARCFVIPVLRVITSFRAYLTVTIVSKRP